MEKINLLLVGGGGHCHSVIESIESTGAYSIIGISDMPGKAGTLVSGYKVITSDEEIPSIQPTGFRCVITVGQIKTVAPRIKLFDFLKEHNIPLSTIIDRHAIVSTRAVIGEGTVVLRQSFINSGVTIGRNCIINSRAMVEHDSVVGDHVHVSTGAIVNGDCHIGDGCFIGSGAIISNGISIAAGTIVGAGSVVLTHIKTPGTYLGNPARRIK